MSENPVAHGRVLIVDDQPPNVLLLEMMLRQAGYADLRSTTNPHAVLAIFAEFKPDIVLMDLHMPGLTGFEVIEQLKNIVANDSYLPILVLTADISAAMKQQALAIGAKDFLSKPFDMTEVLLRIKNLLETHFSTYSCRTKTRFWRSRYKSGLAIWKGPGSRFWNGYPWRRSFATMTRASIRSVSVGSQPSWPKNSDWEMSWWS